MVRYSEAAKRYAQALFELAQESQQEDEVLGQLKEVAKAIETESDLKAYLESPVIPALQKSQMVRAVLPKLKLHPLAENFLAVLAIKNRIALLQEIIGACGSRADEYNGITRGVVQSASDMTPAEKAGIEKAIAEATKKKVVLSYVRDSAVIGGIVARVGSLTFNDSLESHLQRLKDELKRRAY